MKRNELSKIMRQAWAIYKATKQAFAVCLCKAWGLWRMAKRMRTEVVKFAYLKADGTIRKAIGTLKDTAELVKGTGRTDTGKAFKYYDVEAEGFRSFKVENLIAVY